MKIIYTATMEIEVEKSDLFGKSPKLFLEESAEEDSELLLQQSTVTQVKYVKVEESEASGDDDDLDDDDLTEIGEDWE